MIKKRIRILFILLTLFVSSITAQNNIDHLLKVGDKAPAIHTYRWIKGIPVDSFQKGKVYVVEFGATWCKPCAAMIAPLTAIAMSDSVNVDVISFFVMELNQETKIKGEAKYVQGVREYVKKQGNKIGYKVAVDDPGRTLQQTWLTAAGRAGIPVTFIIDRNGMIAWVGNSPENLPKIVEDVSSGHYNLTDYVRENENYLAGKPSFDQNKLLLVNGNGGNDSDFVYRSVLTKYKGDIQAASHEYVNNYRYALPGTQYEHLGIYQGRVQEIGVSLSYLYYMAYGDTLWNFPYFRNPVTMMYPDTIKEPFHKKSYGKYWPRTIIEIGDKTPFLTDSRSIDNKYNYSLKVPLEKGSSIEMQEAMQRDLKTYFGYNAVVETRMMPCWNLKKTTSYKDISTSTPNQEYRHIQVNDSSYLFSNAVVQDLLWRMIVIFDPHYADNAAADDAPFIDLTGIKSEIDYVITRAELNAFKHRDMDGINKFFKRLGLVWEKSSRPMKVVVIKD